jgi:hypothetical protein
VSGYSGFSGYSGLSGYSGSTLATLAYQYSESNGTSSTTSATNQTKTTLTFTPSITGSYFIQFTCELSNSTNNAISYCTFYQGATILGGEIGFKVNVVDTFQSSATFMIVSLTGGTSYTFTIQYRAGSGTANIRNARIMSWRVA